MNTEAMPKCPQCGATLPSDAPDGLCPNCIMAMNLKTETAFSGDATRAQPPLPPEQIAPHFPQLEILECLGRGGMGVVYKARQKTLNRFVALKLLAPERVNDAKFAGRFTREAQALAALNHPNIVTIHDFGQAGGFYFLLMEFVDGTNLRHLLRARKFTPEEALAIVPSLCDALQFAHERGIVHRDIKPENILLDKTGRVKVADFGIAKMLVNGNGEAPTDIAAPDNATQSVVGTPGYSAPEQKSHPQRVDSRADIYSLGVVFYEMLTGELPGKQLQPPSTKVHIDVRLDEIVLRALEKTPERRYQTAVEFRTQVETLAHECSARGVQNEKPALSWAEKRALMQEIRAHMTEPERKQMSLHSALFGIWNAATWFAPVFGGMFAASGFGVMLGLCCSVVGLCFFPFLIRFQREMLCSTAWAKAQGITPEQLGLMSATRPGPHFSPPAIVGAAWATLFFLVAPVFLWHEVNTHEFQNHGPFASRLMFVCFVFILSAVTAPFATTILGWISVTQIRRSAGKICGLGLAVFDGLLFPLLALDGLLISVGILTKIKLDQASIAAGVPLAQPNWADYLWIILPSVPLLAFLDWLIIRAVWRAVNRTADRPCALQPSPPNTPRSIVACCIAYSSGLFAAGVWMLTLSGQSAAPWDWGILITALLGMTLAIGVQRTSCGKHALWFGGIQTLVWIFFAIFFLLQDFRGIPDLVRVDNAGVMQRSPFPKAATIGRNAGTALVVHDDVDVHYVFFAPKAVGTWDSSSHNTHSLDWMDNGALKLTEQWTFGYLRESIDPDHLKVNGKEYDLRQGRVFLPHDDGTLEQRQLEISLATAMDPDALATVIANHNWASSAKLCFGPVIEREVDGAIDFDSGKVVAEPEKFSESNDIAENVLKAVAWLEHKGMDAITEPSQSLKGVNLKAKSVDNDAWDKLTPEQVIATLEMTKRETWQDLDPNRKTDEQRKTPATWIFETHEGGKGILQVLEYSGKGVKVRYKLVQVAQSRASVPAKAIAGLVPTGTFEGEKDGVGAKLDVFKDGTAHLHIQHKRDSVSVDFKVEKIDAGRFLLRCNYRATATEMEGSVKLGELVVQPSGELLLKIAENPRFLDSIPDCDIPLKKVVTQSGSAAPAFGPVMEREIPFHGACLNLATGKVVPVPDIATADKVRELHGDVFQFVFENDLNALMILDARLLELEQSDWTNLSAAALEEKFAQDATVRRTSQNRSETRILPGVYGFKKWGLTGLLQVLGETGPNPNVVNAVKLRYKLVQD